MEVGDNFVSNEGIFYEVIAKINVECVTVRSLDGNNFTKSGQIGNFKRGGIKSPYKRTIYGVGFLGEGKYRPKDNRRRYQCWKNLLSRCYNKSLHKEHPTYSSCTVDEPWKCYQNFAKWYDENYKESFQLDKDIILKGNKRYCHTLCSFVPREVNILFTKCDALRGNLPLGVSANANGAYNANVFIDGVSKYLGRYKTPKLAFCKYKSEKEKNIRRVAEKFKSVLTPPVYKALLSYKVTDDSNYFK